ncbi:MAG: hypothetical protein OQL27_01365, partial [Sedimenticola sp.]|nr:hypothetical protein [Sedimenticola sp.]
NKSGNKDISSFLAGNKAAKGKGVKGGFAPTQQGAVDQALMPAQSALADIASRDSLTVGGSAVQWGSVHSVTGNIPGCQIQLAYHVVNKGKADSPAFALQWIDMNTNQQLKLQRIYGLKKEVEYLRTEMLSLQPGDNRFMLKLDSASEVNELSETNNNLPVTIRYTGRCGLTAIKPPSRSIVVPPSTEKPAPASKFSPIQKQEGFKPIRPVE